MDQLKLILQLILDQERQTEDFILRLELFEDNQMTSHNHSPSQKLIEQYWYAKFNQLARRWWPHPLGHAICRKVSDNLYRVKNIEVSSDFQEHLGLFWS